MVHWISLWLCVFRTGPKTINGKFMSLREAASRKMKAMLATGPQRGQIPTGDQKSALIDSLWLNRSQGLGISLHFSNWVFYTLGTCIHIPGVIGNHRIKSHPPRETNVLENVREIFYTIINVHLSWSKCNKKM